MCSSLREPGVSDRALAVVAIVLTLLAGFYTVHQEVQAQAVQTGKNTADIASMRTSTGAHEKLTHKKLDKLAEDSLAISKDWRHRDYPRHHRLRIG